MSFHKFYKRNYGEDLGADQTAPFVEPVTEEEKTETVVAEAASEVVDVKKMSKTELDAYALKEFGIHLDRRKSLSKMLKDFEKAKSTK